MPGYYSTGFLDIKLMLFIFRVVMANILLVMTEMSKASPVEIRILEKENNKRGDLFGRLMSIRVLIYWRNIE